MLVARGLFLLLSTDPVFMFHSKIDWGPCVLSQLFKVGVLSFFLEYLRNGKPISLLGVFLAYQNSSLSRSSFNPRHDPAIKMLAERIDQTPFDMLVSLDWGLHNSLLELCQPNDLPKMRDSWARFLQMPDDQTQARQIYQQYFENRVSLVVSYTPDSMTFKDIWGKLGTFLKHVNLCLVKVDEVKNDADKPLYRLLTFQDLAPAPEACLPLP